MSLSKFWLQGRLFPCLAVLCILTQLRAQDAELRGMQAPGEDELEDVPANLSRWFGGAALWIPNSGAEGEQSGSFTLINPENQNTHPASHLLSADSTEVFEAPAGRTTVVIDLGDFRPVNRINFIPQSGSGTLSVHISNKLRPLESGKWRPILDNVAIEPSNFVTNLPFKLVYCQYIALTFDSPVPLSISSFGIFGTLTANDFRFNLDESRAAELDRALGEMVSFDFASLASGADVGVVYQRPDMLQGKNSIIQSLREPSARDFRNILDDDPDTFLVMPEGSPEQIIVIDAKTSTQINTISAIVKAPAGRLEFYFVGDLPEELQSAMETVDAISGNILDEEYFEGIPVALFRELDQPGNVFIRGSVENLPGRYLIVRWLPVYPDTDPLIIYELSMLSEIFVEYVDYGGGGQEEGLNWLIGPQVPIDFDPPPTSP